VQLFVFRECSIKNQLSSFLDFTLKQVNLQVMPKFQKQNDACQEVSGNFCSIQKFEVLSIFRSLTGSRMQKYPTIL
jgi:hypothetical protein